PGLSACRGNGRRNRRSLGARHHPKLSSRVSGDHPAGQRRTLGSAADAAIAVTRVSSHARDPSRPTAKGKRGGRFLGKSAHHRRSSQLTAIAQNNGGTGGTIPRANAAFCERTGSASLRRRGSASGGKRLAGTFAPLAVARGYTAGTSASGRTANRPYQRAQYVSAAYAKPVAGQ